MAAPLYYLGVAFKGVKTGADYVKHLKSTVAHFNHLLLFLFLIWIYGFLRKRFQLSEKEAYLGVLIILSASMVLPNTRDFYSEMLWSAAALYSVDQLIYSFYPQKNSSYHPAKHVVASAAMIWFSTALAPILGDGCCVDLFRFHRTRQVSAEFSNFFY